MKRQTLLDALWLTLLAAYILAGVRLTPFHGDEAMQITMSRDYFTAFVERQPELLPVAPPYTVDSEDWLRLINGSVNRYSIGLALHLAGYGVEALPALWQWPLSVEDNLARGSQPGDAVLFISRLPSALFLVASVAALFALGRQLGGRPAAYLASTIYALHPVILLNGRRAMMEGSLLCFGLLTLLAAAYIVQHRHDWRGWLMLIICGALTLASKHSGVVFVAAALAWIFTAQSWEWFNGRGAEHLNLTPKSPLRGERGLPKHDLLPLSSDANERLMHTASPSASRRRGGWGVRLLRGNQIDRSPLQTHLSPSSLITHYSSLLLSSLAVVALFVALSPALWSNPPARLADLLAERGALLDSQVRVAGDAALTFDQRLLALVTQPYLTPPQFYEAAFWGGSALVQSEIIRYQQSPWSGVQSSIIGLLLTVCAGIGLLWRTRQCHVPTSSRYPVGLVAIWLALTAVVLLANPLPWQRYYLALIPPIALLSTLGIMRLVHWARSSV
ncbi:MAG: glycosyltransferase family 39 protein [Anaerolineae bacterium]|nr:glycosyltransferase family 39 protein [Anaerolineae bacterium]